jgi:GLPGLI family protein
MKTTLLCLVFSFQVFYSCAQTEGFIRYKIEAFYGKTSYSKLFFNNTQSLYIKEEAEDVVLQNGKNKQTSITHEYTKFFSDIEVRTGIKQKPKGSDQFIRTKFLLELPSWKLFTDTKSINGYTCRKATINRPDVGPITAWYAESIPIRMGPPTFWGLPGLILELEYEIGTKFTAQEIKFQPVAQEKIQLTEGPLVTAEEYSNMKSKVKAMIEKTNKVFSQGDN